MNTTKKITRYEVPEDNQNIIYKFVKRNLRDYCRRCKKAENERSIHSQKVTLN